MSGHHEPCGPQEVFIGNTLRHGGSMTHLSPRFKTARIGSTAYDIEGKPLPEQYAPIFIHRDEEQAHSDYMVERAFGPYWRRG
jgi:hypothetical protein